jgi:acyl-coenzyme A synthetase/AMP-(fatty) acid ligase
MAQFDVVKQGDFPSLERLLWCGEALPTPTLIYWMQRLPHVVFTNLYGPTETTIASSYYTVPSCPESEKAEIPIGTPCDGEELLVLSDSLAPVPEGEIGDLYIRGVGLSPGYWRDPDKTASVFLDADGGRMYKTGDLARVGKDGLVYLLGRADSQIKSRGYRIELGEIESALHALGAVRECAVVAIPTEGFEGNAICCAYVDRSPGGIFPAELRDRLARLVPPYMLPANWMAVDALPLNGNGKVDRPLLRRWFQERAAKPAAASEAASA